MSKNLESINKKIQGIINFYGSEFFKNKKILDLGCGEGDLAGALLGLGADVTAVDIRDQHLLIANKKYNLLKTIKLDLDKEWPFSENEFDLIISWGVVCHIKDYENHIKNICKTAKYIILETAVCDSIREDKNLIVQEDKSNLNYSYNGFGCRPSINSVSRILKESNFNYTQISDSYYNYENYKYDWHMLNNNQASLYKRKIWFCNHSNVLNNNLNKNTENLMGKELSSISLEKELSNKKINFIKKIFSPKYFMNKNILDAGAGLGDISFAIENLGGAVTAMDIRKEYLANIKKINHKITTIEYNFESTLNIKTKFDVTFSIGTLCHLVNYESHLKNLCDKSKDLILETAVCDSNNVSADFKTIDNNSVSSGSLYGAASFPSAEKIEKILTEQKMFFVRIDSSDLNFDNFKYDWKVQNTNAQSLYQRRFWICSKNLAIINQIKNTYFKILEKNHLSKITPLSINEPVKIQNITQPLTNVNIITEKKLDGYNETLLINKSDKFDISIIIPAWKCKEFIVECISSIRNQKSNLNCEILLGIDACQETLDFVKNNPDKFNDVKVFWFEENVGPYVVKNSLIDIANSENILFFDADDIMNNNLLNHVFLKLKTHDVVVFNYMNFQNSSGISSGKKHNAYADGCFAIKKSSFISINGFENWRCAADSEFHLRAKKNNLSYFHIKEILFNRRLHTTNLTVKPDTNSNSQLRLKYKNIINDKNKNKNWTIASKITNNFSSVLNGLKINNSLSIIIPAWKSSSFIEECVSSIKKQILNHNVEILIGIDACQETLDFVKNNPDTFKDISVYWFEENVGPYVIKNTLSQFANNKNFIFFDSDDIMHENMISIIIENLKEDHIIRSKYYNFNDKDMSKLEISSFYGHGVFAISKKLFLTLNGFEPWRCSADAEFHTRASKNNIKYTLLEDNLFYRRKHENNLTSRPETKANSSLRLEYINIIKNKTNWKLEKLSTSNKFKKLTLLDFNKEFLHLVISRVCVKWNHNGKYRHEVLGLNWDNFVDLSNELYDKYARKSLNNQTIKNFKLISLFDKDTKKYGNLISNEEILPVDDINSITQHIKEYIKNNSKDYKYILITRLDRDDAIENNFIEKLQNKALHYLEKTKNSSHYYFDIKDHLMYDINSKNCYYSNLYNTVTSPFITVLEPINNIICYAYAYSHGDIYKHIKGDKIKDLKGLQVIHSKNISNTTRGSKINLSNINFGI